MKDEVFNVEFEYNGENYLVRVKADLPVGPEPFGSDYDIYVEGKHKYTINHCRNEDEVHCWEIKKQPKKNRDPEFVQAVGRAIDKYYRNGGSLKAKSAAGLPVKKYPKGLRLQGAEVSTK